MKRPTTEKERYVVLDALRGMALMGIALANFPEFALWTFLSADEQGALPTASLDRVVRFLDYFLVDGKFYTIFSLLFGIGFSLFLARHPVSLFLRRMLILAFIGLFHLLFIWSGDILLLYSVGGLLLPLFFRMKDRQLLLIAGLLILLPVGLDAVAEFAGVDFARPFYDAWWRCAESEGIDAGNFATWLRDAHTYNEMYAFLIQGAYERMWEFVAGHRLLKVLGLFILGYLIGKHRLYARLSELPLERYLDVLLVYSYPMSLVYAWSAVNGHPFGEAVHSLLYTLSVIPMAFCYIVAICLFYLHYPKLYVFNRLADAGRMALSCYIGQSLIGVLLFYGLGLGLGASLGLVYVELIAFLVFSLQVACCHFWLRHFRFGPLEWLWRILTYGRLFPIRKNT